METSQARSPAGPASGRKAKEPLNRNFIRTRFPHRSEIIAVWAVAVFACYTWTMIGFFNKLSSFLLYFTPAEIGEIFAFMMAFALLESLCVTIVLLLLSAILPSAWLKDGFAAKGFVILAIAAATAILFQKMLTDDLPSTGMLLGFAIGPIALMIAALFLLRSMPKLQNILLNIQDRILILLFIYVPIGVVSLMVVLYRNLL